MNKMKLFLATQMVATCLVVFFTSALVFGESLQEEFEKLCIHTHEAENLTMDRLQELLTECDLLQNKIAAGDDAKKKVLMFRLNKCCDFYAYIIELKKAENPSDSK